jgi:hypothetical protein
MASSEQSLPSRIPGSQIVERYLWSDAGRWRRTEDGIWKQSTIYKSFAFKGGYETVLHKSVDVPYTPWIVQSSHQSFELGRLIQEA